MNKTLKLLTQVGLWLVTLNVNSSTIRKKQITAASTNVKDVKSGGRYYYAIIQYNLTQI